MTVSPKAFTNFGLSVLRDRYLLEGEKPDDMFQRVAKSYAYDSDHQQRMYSYMQAMWFMPATPILSNAGTKRGLPISCFLNNVDDCLESISNTWNENVWLAAKGGGIGTCWSDVRSVGQSVQGRGGSSGIIPFVKVMDSLTLAISQGSLRRGASACYLDISHPEVEEFLEIRKPTGDFNRKSLNIHQGITVSDAFMNAVVNNKQWNLVDPATQEVKSTVIARELFQKVIETRISTGEPYIVFSDTVNRQLAPHHHELNLKVKQSNLCSEIMLPTGIDHRGQNRTAVCCLGSVNLEYFDEWENHPLFIQDCLLFLDRVLANFIELTENLEGFEKARYSAMQENSVGLGAMGFQSFLQKNNVPFESVTAKSWNIRIFKHIHCQAENANTQLAKILGSCPDAQKTGHERRFSYMLAIAPTANISIIAGGCSPCIEPINSNIYTHKTLTGSFEVKNKYLIKLLKEKNKDTAEVWDQIIEDQGSVQMLDFLSDEEKAIFQTAFEINQRWLIEFAGDRSPYIDQGQSVNLFMKGDADKWDLLMIHVKAWQAGIKSLYYLRSRSVQRAGFAGGVERDNKIDRDKVYAHSVERVDYEECLSCQ